MPLYIWLNCFMGPACSKELLQAQDFKKEAFFTIIGFQS